MICNGLKFMKRAIKMPTDSLLHQSYLENLNFSGKNSWWNNCKLTYSKDHTDPSEIDIFKTKIKMQNKFKIYWHKCLFDDSNKEHGNKLRHYRSFKSNFLKEEYLSKLWYKPYRSSVASLRLSSHKLHIETGRYAREGERLPPSQRICKYCTSGLCEDEFHFMIHCDLYKDFRSDLLNTIKS